MRFVVLLIAYGSSPAKAAAAGANPIVRLDAGGWITGCSKQVMAWNGAHFEGLGPILPVSLSEWLKGGIGSRMPPEQRAGLQRLRILVFLGSGDQLQPAFRRIEPAFRAASLGRIGLSQAETAIIARLTRGKQNQEIGLVRSLAPNVIEKHLASVVSTLGVEARTAAAWMIIERTGGAAKKWLQRGSEWVKAPIDIWGHLGYKKKPCFSLLKFISKPYIEFRHVMRANAVRLSTCLLSALCRQDSALQILHTREFV